MSLGCYGLNETVGRGSKSLGFKKLHLVFYTCWKAIVTPAMMRMSFIPGLMHMCKNCTISATFIINEQCLRRRQCCLFRVSDLSKPQCVTSPAVFVFAPDMNNSSNHVCCYFTK